jgi:hypothetical protein
LQRSILRSSRSKSLTPHKSPGFAGEIQILPIFWRRGRKSRKADISNGCY